MTAGAAGAVVAMGALIVRDAQATGGTRHQTRRVRHGTRDERARMHTRTHTQAPHAAQARARATHLKGRRKDSADLLARLAVWRLDELSSLAPCQRRRSAP